MLILLFNYLSRTFYKVSRFLKCSRFYTAGRGLFLDCVFPGRVTVWPCRCTTTFRKKHAASLFKVERLNTFDDMVNISTYLHVVTLR
jgi:hypothetical protein